MERPGRLALRLRSSACLFKPDAQCDDGYLMKRRRTQGAQVFAFMLATAIATLGVSAQRDHDHVAQAAPSQSGTPSAFESVGPARLADTRQPVCSCQRIDARTIRVEVGGRAGVPQQISAAAITLTIAGSTVDGFATLFPTGSNRPLASTVNYVARGDIGNSTIIRVGDGGAIDVYTSSDDAHVIVDVTGVFTETTEATSGRFVSSTPRRVLDGRQPGALVGLMEHGSSATIPMPVPADATAVAINVTSLEAPKAGYLTGFAAGGNRPDTSFLNPDGSGSPVAAAVILPVSASGITISNTAGGRLLIDLTGYFTGPSAPSATDGLFVATTQKRLLDTRPQVTRVWADGAVEVPSPFPNASALVTNVTLVATDGPGFMSAFPAGVQQPVVSAVNAARRDHTIPNAAITSTSTRGMAYFSSVSTDLIIDMTGYFVGTPMPATQPVPTNTPVPRRVLMVGDSTLAVLRNVTQTQELFVGFDPVLDAEGCRRLVWRSCFSNTDLRVPNTVEEAILDTPGVVDVVIVMAGYNDWNDPFGSFVNTIMRAARSKGARQVIWLTYSEGIPPGSSPAAIAAYAQNTHDLWAAAPLYSDLVVADWRTYNSRSVGWMGADGVHLRTRGGYGLADYFSRWMAYLDQRACTAPEVPGGTPRDPCPNPNSATRVPDIAGLYGI
jgi:hypothetical protein